MMWRATTHSVGELGTVASSLNDGDCRVLPLCETGGDGETSNSTAGGNEKTDGEVGQKELVIEDRGRAGTKEGEEGEAQVTTRYGAEEDRQRRRKIERAAAETEESARSPGGV